MDAGAVEQAGLNPPGLFVIGPTVSHGEGLDWFGAKPLAGQRLVIVKPAGSLGDALDLAGAEVVEVPLPVTPAAKAVMGALPLTGCILSSADEVDALDDERDAEGWSAETIAWCFGKDTAARARESGWQSVVELDPSSREPEMLAAIAGGISGRGNGGL